MTARVAIVGSGLGGFVAYTTLRHASPGRHGLEPAEITVFGDDPDPAGAWRPRAAAIRQRLMRSESDGHCYPTSFPGLAAREAARRRDLAPLVLSVCNRYLPTVDQFLAHVDELRASSRWDESFRRARVERVRAVDGGFELDRHGVFRHVLLAPGHPGLVRPAELEEDPRAVHAYEPHEYASRIAIVGAGMAAATEWLNALAAGAEVVSVRRREPARRPLNVARPLFSKRGLAGFRAVPRARRAELLRGLGEPSYPPGRGWDAPIEEATRKGRFRVERELNDTGFQSPGQVICATGFRRGFEHDRLLAGLVHEHGLEPEERWIVLADDSTVPELTDATRTLSLAGAPAQWAFPAADTLVGMKIAARSFRKRVERCPTR